MNKVIIGKKNIFFTAYSENQEEWIKKDILEIKNPFTWYLPYNVEIEEDVTVKDVLMHLKKQELLIDVVFCGYLGGAKLKDFIDEANLEPDLDFKENIEVVELCWDAEIEPLSLEMEGVGEFNIYNIPGMRGVKTETGIDPESPEYYAEELDLTLVALRNYANTRITTNSYVEYAILSDISDPLPETVMDGEMQWSLFDFISTLLAEISYYGAPKEQRAIIEEITREESDAPSREVFIEQQELMQYLGDLVKKLND